MSTRANILIKDGTDQLWFYRHSDGYPESTAVSLAVFMGWLKTGRIRNDLGQAAGWLVILGNTEYRGEGRLNDPDYARSYGSKQDEPGNGEEKGCFMGWKVGAYEPTTCEHGDIEYRYTIDLAKKTLICEHVGGGYDDKPVTYKRVPVSKYLKPALKQIGTASATGVKPSLRLQS